MLLGLLQVPMSDHRPSDMGMDTFFRDKIIEAHTCIWHEYTSLSIIEIIASKRITSNFTCFALWLLGRTRISFINLMHSDAFSGEMNPKAMLTQDFKIGNTQQNQ